MTAQGLRNWLPDEAKKQEFVTNKLLELYGKWSYEPIEIPTLIDAYSLSQSNKKFIGKTFPVVDKDGQLLALRPELTTPIAKAVSSRLEKLELPLRLYYSSTIFRHSGKPTDDSREIKQVGIELIGTKEFHSFSNAEIINLFIESAKQFGLKDFKVALTHSSIWKKIFELYEEGELAYDLLQRGDFLAFKTVIAKDHPMRILIETDDISKIEKTLGIELPFTKEIKETYGDLSVFDPSLCPDVDFYTGVYFKLLTESEGTVIAAGGRYDNLFKSFGADLPSIGFAYNLQSLINALNSQNLIPEFKDKAEEIKPEKTWEKTLKAANDKIAKGKTIKVKLN